MINYFQATHRNSKFKAKTQTTKYPTRIIRSPEKEAYIYIYITLGVKYMTL